MTYTLQQLNVMNHLSSLENFLQFYSLKICSSTHISKEGPSLNKWARIK